MALEQVEETFVKQYSDNVLYAASQTMSKLYPHVTHDSVNAEEKYYDYYGTVEMLEKTQRFGDSPINATPRSSRRLALFAYETGEPLDSFDVVRTLNDPASPILLRHGQAVARQFDRTIINAALGGAYVGRKNPQLVNLPSSQLVAVNDHTFDSGSGVAGLTLSKLIKVKDVFGMADVDTDTGINLAVTQRQLSNLLSDTTITSADYNTVRALVNGEINQFMGISFKKVSPTILPRVQESSNWSRRCVAFMNDSVVLGQPSNGQKAEIGKRPDKGFAWYAYMELFVGATRTDEDKVIEVRCDEGAVA